ncbi:hypothetical protein [Bacillus pseudomycoides]|nr:hypothetical protein [Bacillus pseudomycoides]EEM04878.1 hypothetical protein bmyco0002_26760 [Bacillus pseudomycoides]EEM10456.1 hypothetical protein bmyco0003_28130 [Bacillus pseudomycoides]KFN13525.1 hypothetical protein DJ94_4541 [Bacillus pseudomycoides]
MITVIGDWRVLPSIITGEGEGKGTFVLEEEHVKEEKGTYKYNISQGI